MLTQFIFNDLYILRTDLTMIPDKYELLGPQHSRDHALRLRGLHALVYQDAAEPHPGQLRVPGPDTGAADHVSHVQQLLLALLPQDPVPLLVTAAQLAGLLLQQLELPELGAAL